MNPVARQLSILLVEDNDTDIELIREAISFWEQQPKLETAPDGERAMTLLREKAAARSGLPDLVFLDLNLPKKGGIEVLREIKSEPELARIPVIVLTTSDREADINLAYGSHANCYLIKPLEFETLVERVRAVEQFWQRHVRLPGHTARAAGTRISNVAPGTDLG